MDNFGYLWLTLIYLDVRWCQEGVMRFHKGVVYWQEGIKCFQEGAIESQYNFKCFLPSQQGIRWRQECVRKVPDGGSRVSKGV